MAKSINYIDTFLLTFDIIIITISDRTQDIELTSYVRYISDNEIVKANKWTVHFVIIEDEYHTLSFTHTDTHTQLKKGTHSYRHTLIYIFIYIYI